MNPRQLIAVGVIMELAYLSFYFFPESPNEVLLFIGVNAVTFVLLTAVWIRTRTPAPEAHPPMADNPEPRMASVILGFAILFRLTLVFHPPVASGDIYRYVWDGKVAAHGVNPFRYAPDDSSLAPLRTEQLPLKINFPAMRTIYPPLAQALFLVSYELFGDSITGLKFLLVLADLGSLAMLMLILNGGGTLHPPPADAGFITYAWSPLPILYFGLDGHIDAFGIPFLLLFIYLAQRNRYLASAVSLGLAGLAKLYPLFVVPFLSSCAEGWKRFVLPLVPIAMLVAGCWLYWEQTGGLFESFKVFSAEFEFNGSVFHIVYEFVTTNKLAHLVSSILFLVWLGVVFFLNRSIREKTFLAFLGFIVLAPVVHPWYLTWLAALLVLRWSAAVFALLGLSALSNTVVYQYRLTGIWEEKNLTLLIEYLPFYWLLVREITTGKFFHRREAMT